VPEDSAEEKTELPTPKKLRDARKRGQVFKSQDVNSTFVLGAALLFLAIMIGLYLPWLAQFLIMPSYFYQESFPDALNTVMSGSFSAIMWMSIPMALTVAIAAVMVNFFQVGAVFSVEQLKPSMKKLNPVEGAKKLFSIKSVLEFVKSLLKVIFLGVLLALAIKASISSLVNLPYGGTPAILQLLSNLLIHLSIITMIAFIVFGAADFFLQKYQYIKDLKMTKDEVKREYKETEGDPIIKSKRRALAKEIAMSNSVESARKATVVVTNPTHYAVALEYEKGRTKLPIVTAKGEGFVAQAMVKAAQEAGVPVMQNVPLAQALHHHVEVNQYISSDLIEPVAEVLRYVRRMKEEQGLSD
jgi:type III secretion protein U